MLHLFTPVGISVFLNLVRWAKDIQHPKTNDLEAALNACFKGNATNKEKELLTTTIKNKLFNNQSTNQHKKNQTQTFLNYQASAEIQSIHQILQHPKWQGIKFRLHLLATDSQTSHLAAKIIKAYFQENPRIEVIKVKKIEQLQINQSDQFQDNGIQTLIDYIHTGKKKRINISGKNYQFEGLLNITSGYKGITPILTIVGQLLNIPLVYLYERSDNLIEIPPLPLSFNWNQLELFQYCFAKLITESSSNKKNASNPKFSINWLEHDGIRKFFYSEILANALAREVSPGNTYEITFLGKLLRHHIEQVYPSGTRAFGWAFEFSFYEAFINEPLVWEDYNFDWVIHHKEIVQREFDIELRVNRHTPNPFIVGEICSYGQLADFKSDRKYKFLVQLKKQVKVFSSETYCPWGYMLLVYRYEGMSDWNLLKESIRDIKEKLSKIGIHRFRVFGVKLPILIKSTRTKNPYSDLYQKQITRNEQKWRKGNRHKYGNPWLWLEELSLLD